MSNSYHDGFYFASLQYILTANFTVPSLYHLSGLYQIHLLFLEHHSTKLLHHLLSFLLAMCPAHLCFIFFIFFLTMLSLILVCSLIHVDLTLSLTYSWHYFFHWCGVVFLWFYLFLYFSSICHSWYYTMIISFKV